jgi:hypothetical protein
LSKAKEISAVIMSLADVIWFWKWSTNLACLGGVVEVEITTSIGSKQDLPWPSGSRLWAPNRQSLFRQGSSLFHRFSSLFREKFSLLGWLGNSLRKPLI